MHYNRVTESSVIFLTSAAITSALWWTLIKLPICYLVSCVSGVMFYILI